jgi:GT2 family glycosyltransferase
LSYEMLEGTAAAWREYRSNLEREVLPVLAGRYEAMKARPRISVLMATYETPAAMLRAALDSVLAQVYREWELCVVDDGSKASHVAQVLREYASRDPRIKVELAEENGGVARASNRALAMATGEYVALMDHDDRLEEQALLRFAESIVEDAPDMLYSDEVLMAPDGEHAMELVYRPAFSLELLRSHPYIVHLVAFRTALARDAGGFDESLRISQDYDLILRCAEKATRVVHVPEVLYRWRTHPASAGHQMMDRVVATSTAILQRHLERSAADANAAPGFGFNFFESRYRLAPGSRVAIVIPTRNQGELLRACVESLRATTGEAACDVFVVDHQSDDPATLAYLQSSRDITRVLRYEGPFNFSAINNHAVGDIGPEYSHYLFCNNDIEAIAPGWLGKMLALAQRPDVGIVGAKLLYSDRVTIQHAGVGVGLFVRAEHYGKFVQVPQGRVVPGYYGAFHVTREVAAVTGACLLARADVFAQVGGFDESLAVGFGDVDLCLRVLAAGYRVLHCAGATLVHHESATRGRNDRHPADSALFEEKWRALLAAGDPYYHPGFSTTSTTWQTRRPLPFGADLRRRVVDIDRAAGRHRVRVGATVV